MAGGYKADHRMRKWSLKFVCQFFVMIATLDKTIATYTDHIKIMSYRGLKSMCHAGSFKHCFNMLHKDAYKVHLISGSLILQIAVAIIHCSKYLKEHCVFCH